MCLAKVITESHKVFSVVNFSNKKSGGSIEFSLFNLYFKRHQKHFLRRCVLLSKGIRNLKCCFLHSSCELDQIQSEKKNQVTNNM